MKKLVLFATGWLGLLVYPAPGQGVRPPPPTPAPASPRALLSAYIRHASAARACQRSLDGQAPAADYLLALQAWYRSGLPAEVLTGPAAEDFFAAHQAILTQRAALPRPGPQRPGPQRPPLSPAARRALAATHNASSAHLRQLVALTKTARQLPLPAQHLLVQRLTVREQALWQAAQALESPPRPGP